MKLPTLWAEMKLNQFVDWFQFTPKAYEKLFWITSVYHIASIMENSLENSLHRIISSTLIVWGARAYQGSTRNQANETMVCIHLKRPHHLFSLFLQIETWFYIK